MLHNIAPDDIQYAIVSSSFVFFLFCLRFISPPPNRFHPGFCTTRIAWPTLWWRMVSWRSWPIARGPRSWPTTLQPSAKSKTGQDFCRTGWNWQVFFVKTGDFWLLVCIIIGIHYAIIYHFLTSCAIISQPAYFVDDAHRLFASHVLTRSACWRLHDSVWIISYLSFWLFLMVHVCANQVHPMGIYCIITKRSLQRYIFCQLKCNFFLLIQVVDSESLRLGSRSSRGDSRSCAPRPRPLARRLDAALEGWPLATDGRDRHHGGERLRGREGVGRGAYGHSGRDGRWDSDLN